MPDGVTMNNAAYHVHDRYAFGSRANRNKTGAHVAIDVDVVTTARVSCGDAILVPYGQGYWQAINAERVHAPDTVGVASRTRSNTSLHVRSQ